MAKSFILIQPFFQLVIQKKDVLGYLSIAFIVTKDEQNKTKLKHYILSQKSAQVKNNQDFEQKVEQRIEIALKKEKTRFDELKNITYVLEDGLNQTKLSKKKLAYRVQYLEDEMKALSQKDKNNEMQLKQLLKESRQDNYETHKKK